MGNEIAASSQVRMDGGDMEGARIFILEFAMLDHRPFAQDHFRSGVGEIRFASNTGISLENRRLTVLLGNYQITRMRGRTGLFAGCNKQQVNWRGQRFSPRNVN